MRILRSLQMDQTLYPDQPGFLARTETIRPFGHYTLHLHISRCFMTLMSTTWTQSSKSFIYPRYSGWSWILLTTSMLSREVEAWKLCYFQCTIRPSRLYHHKTVCNHFRKTKIACWQDIDGVLRWHWIVPISSVVQSS